MFLSEIFQLRGESSDLGEVVSNERLTTFTLDTLPAEKYSMIKMQTIRNPDLSLKKIMNTMKTVFIDHSEDRLFRKGVKGRIVKVVIAVVSQQ